MTQLWTTGILSPPCVHAGAESSFRIDDGDDGAVEPRRCGRARWSGGRRGWWSQEMTRRADCPPRKAPAARHNTLVEVMGGGAHSTE